MDSTNDATTTFHLPAELLERSRKVAKILRTPMSQLFRDALDEKIRFHEERFRNDAAMLAAEKATKKAKRFAYNTASRRPVGSPLAPLPTLDSRLSAASTSRAATAAAPSKLDLIYADFARQILATSDANGNADRVEVKRLVILAEKAVRREAPLTHPTDDVILRNIEAAVIRLRESGVDLTKEDTIARSYDDAVGSIVNAAAVKTHGDVED